MRNSTGKHALLHCLPILLMLLLFAGCSRNGPANPPGRQEPFRVCVGGVLAILPFIAEEKGFFRSEGVSAEITLLGDGKAAMAEFLDGRCESVLSGESPVVRQSFDRSDLAVIATLTSSDNGVKVFARRDRGIASPADLVGKRIGVSKGTISNFFFDQFLRKNGIAKEKIAIVDISHQTIADAFMRGVIDAYSGSDFAYLKGRQLVGDKGVTFAEPGLTIHSACLTVRKEWLSSHGETAQKVLKALLRAEKELARHPDEQIPILSKRLNFSESDLKSIVADQYNRLSLDQAIILTMEDEARWMLETGVVKGKPVPNFLQVIDPAALSAVNPDAVRLR